MTGQHVLRPPFANVDRELSAAADRAARRIAIEGKSPRWNPAHRADAAETFDSRHPTGPVPAVRHTALKLSELPPVDRVREPLL